MKKLLTTLTCVTLFAVTANADFARVEMGGGLWQNTPMGKLNFTDTITNVQGNYISNEESKENGYAWLLVKHPIPVLPNLRLEYTAVEDTGRADGKFDDFIITGSADVLINMRQYDAILYYNILDNTAWTTLDLGVDIKFIDTDFRAYGTIDNIPNSDDSVSQTLVLPMLYARARVEIPFTGIGLEVDGKYVTYGGSTVSDFKAKVDYTFDFIPVIQPGIEIGYRVQKFDLTYNDDQTKMNLDFAGFYAGLMLRF